MTDDFRRNLTPDVSRRHHKLTINLRRAEFIAIRQASGNLPMAEWARLAITKAIEEKSCRCL